MRPSHLLLCLPFASGLTSCSSHSLRPGIWEITIHDVHRMDTNEPLIIPKREARLEIDWAKRDKDPDVIEEVALDYIASTAGTGETTAAGSPPSPKSMFADIESREEREEKIFRLKAEDGYWIWRMSGVIRNSEHIFGTRFDARILRSSLTAFEGGSGSWSMRWLRDN